MSVPQNPSLRVPPPCEGLWLLSDPSNLQHSLHRMEKDKKGLWFGLFLSLSHLLPAHLVLHSSTLYFENMHSPLTSTCRN